MKAKQLMSVAEPVSARIFELGLKAFIAELQGAKEQSADIDRLCASLDRTCTALDNLQETIANWTYEIGLQRPPTKSK